MEYVEGKSYYQIQEKEIQLPFPAVVHCMAGILRALAHAHAKGVVHRDIKPSNVMLARDRVIKITDFGLAKILRRASDQGSERASGTPLYMSPEQILGEPLDFRTDIYAFGGTAYHLLAGEPPFIEGEVLYHHVHTEPQPLKEHRPDIPDGIASIVERCLKKNPKERFQKASDVLAALRSAQ
jgi:serine/threonine-protein kinase